MYIKCNLYQKNELLVRYFAEIKISLYFDLYWHLFTPTIMSKLYKMMIETYFHCQESTFSDEICKLFCENRRFKYTEKVLSDQIFYEKVI